MRALLVLVIGLAACSVPDVDLEGKQCPCAAGYVCDKPTNRCFPPNGDGGVIDARGTTSCLGGSTVEIYRYMNDFAAWQNPDMKDRAEQLHV